MAFAGTAGRLLSQGRTGLTQFARWMSANASTIPKLAFPEMKKELESPNTILIDVREPAELVTDGKIPNSKNIPLGQIEAAFRLSDEAFQAKYGFSKPSNTQPIITHCKMGMRAMKAANALNQAGFQTVKVYDGIQDWIANGGPLEK